MTAEAASLDRNWNILVQCMGCCACEQQVCPRIKINVAKGENETLI